MSTTPNTIIATARSIINDTDATNYRYADADLLSYINEAIAEMVRLAPHLFYKVTELTCVQGAALQRLDPTLSTRLVDVLNVLGGDVVTKKDRETMNAVDPGWMSATEAAAIHWIPYEDDPNSFLVYPPPPANQVLVAVYVSAPAPLVATDALPFSDAYTTPITNYVVGRAELRDDVAVLQQRAQGALMQFYTAFGALPPGAQPQGG